MWGSGARGSAARTTLDERGEKWKRVAKLKCHLEHGSLQLGKTALLARRARGAGRLHAALWFGGCCVAITQVINALPPNPSPLWTSNNPDWEFQAFAWGQAKPALLADSTSPYAFPGRERALAARSRSPAFLWQSRSRGHPPLR